MQGSFAALMQGAIDELKKPPTDKIQPPTTQTSHKQRKRLRTVKPPKVAIGSDTEVKQEEDPDRSSSSASDDAAGTLLGIPDSQNLFRKSMKLDKKYVGIVHGFVPMKDFNRLWGPSEESVICPTQEMFCRIVSDIIKQINERNIQKIIETGGEDTKETSKLIDCIFKVSSTLCKQWEEKNTYATSSLVCAGERKVFERLFCSRVLPILQNQEYLHKQGKIKQYLMRFLRRNDNWCDSFGTAVGTYLCWDILKKEGRSSIKEHNRAEFDFDNSFKALMRQMLRSERDFNTKIRKMVVNEFEENIEHEEYYDYTESMQTLTV